MLEYLGYALFVMLVIACLGYVMRSLESEEASSPDQMSRHSLHPAVVRRSQAPKGSHMRGVVRPLCEPHACVRVARWLACG
jgi:hypothetical protein